MNILSSLTKNLPSPKRVLLLLFFNDVKKKTVENWTYIEENWAWVSNPTFIKATGKRFSTDADGLLWRIIFVKSNQKSLI